MSVALDSCQIFLKIMIETVKGCVMLCAISKEAATTGSYILGHTCN